MTVIQLSLPLIRTINQSVPFLGQFINFSSYASCQLSRLLFRAPVSTRISVQFSTGWKIIIIKAYINKWLEGDVRNTELWRHVIYKKVSLKPSTVIRKKLKRKSHQTLLRQFSTEINYCTQWNLDEGINDGLIILETDQCLGTRGQWRPTFIKASNNAKIVILKKKIFIPVILFADKHPILWRLEEEKLPIYNKRKIS